MALNVGAKSDYSRSMCCAVWTASAKPGVKEMTMKNADLKSRKDAATPRGVGVMCDFYAARAENAELWDVEGRRFIDFAAGIAVCNTGHRHPKILAAIRDQLDHFTHTAYQIVPYASYVE